MPVVKLNPDNPERFQLKELSDIDTSYETFSIEFSLIAEKAFCTVKETWDFKLRGPSSAYLFKKGETPPEGLEVTENKDTVKPSLQVSNVIPVWTPLMDPREPPYNGNPEKLAEAIGLLLAKHIIEQTQKLKAVMKISQQYRSEVNIFQRIPVTHLWPNHTGMPLSIDKPMLKGRVELVFIK